MSVIVELALPAEEFELGRVLEMDPETSIVLETMVPLGEQSVPFFRLLSSDRDSFEDAVRGHPAVDDLQVVNSHDDEVLYALDWAISRDAFFETLLETDAHLLGAAATGGYWQFELRFPSHERLSAFQTHCVETGIPLDVKRIYNPTRPDAGPWYGLTALQRETLTRAVEVGYYAIPRRTSTRELAEEFDISDQAVTERLRRAITTLVTNTLHVEQEA